MKETLKKPKHPRPIWKERGCTAVAPTARFDDHGNLIFVWHWYDVYREHMEMYMDTPHAQLPVYKPKNKQEMVRMGYENTQGVTKMEWMTKEDSRNKRIRADCAKLAKITKQKLTHPN